MSRLRPFAVAALIVALGVWTGQVYAQQQAPQAAKDVVVTGIGSIVAGDKAKAKEDAINNALRNAVQQVVGTQVSSQTLTENFMLVNDRIFTQSSGYISSYDILNELEEADMITVTVRATVAESDIVDDLAAIGLIMARMDFPRLLVLIDEQVFLDEGGEERTPTTINNQSTATAFMEQLAPKGFRFVDAAIVAANTEANVLASALEGDAAQAIQIGRAHQAEVVILGTTIAKRGTAAQEMLGSMVSMQASISLQAYSADTGELIATSQETQAQVGGGAVDAAQRAIIRTMNRLGPRLEEMILEKWSQQLQSGRVVELVITNEFGFADVHNFIQLLPYYVRGCENVVLKNYAESLATIELNFKGGGMALAGELSAKTWEEYNVTVSGVTANQVRVRITPKDGQ